jgi:hypothetical protein
MEGSIKPKKNAKLKPKVLFPNSRTKQQWFQPLNAKPIMTKSNVLTWFNNCHNQ